MGGSTRVPVFRAGTPAIDSRCAAENKISVLRRKAEETTRKRGAAHGDSKLPAQPVNAPRPTLHAPTTLTPGRRWLFRLIALAGIPLLLLLVAELALRVAGYGYSTHFFKKAVISGRACLVDNDSFGLRFFPPTLARFPAPIVMDAVKQPGTFRIFIFGESAALGDPRPNFGAGRYLEVLLRERFPNARFEVVNTGVTAINSHVVREIAGECAHLQGDCWILYMGNNEMVGPFGAATVFGRQAPPLWVVRLALGVQKTRLGQFLVQLSRKVRGSSGDSWHGMEMFLQNRVPPADPRKSTVYANFGGNLDAILRSGSHAGVKTLLNTVAVNLADCAPFASLPGAGVTGAETASYQAALSEGDKAVERGDLPTAVENFRKAALTWPDSAEAHFRLARSLLLVTNGPAAAEQFLLAADNDALPFRTDSWLNGIIRNAAQRTAAGGTLAFCDAAALMGTNTAAGVPGHESFFEHVHLNFDGNYRLAHLWAEQVAAFLPPGFKEPAAAKWADQARCEALLGLSDWNRLSTLDEMIGRLKQPPFQDQYGNPERIAALQRWVGELNQRTNGPAVQHTDAVYQEALGRAPDDYRLHQNYAEFLEATGRREPAIARLRGVCELIPHYYFSYFQLGCALKRDGKVAEAKEQLLKAAVLCPTSGEVQVELGMVYGRGAEWENALAAFTRAAQLSPEDPRIPLYTGEVLRKLNRRPEAIDSFRAALRLNPNYWEAHFRLGEEHANQRQFGEAAKEFQETVRLNPAYAKGHVSFAGVLRELGRTEEARRHLEDALRLDSSNREAQALLNQLGR